MPDARTRWPARAPRLGAALLAGLAVLASPTPRADEPPLPAPPPLPPLPTLTVGPLDVPMLGGEAEPVSPARAACEREFRPEYAQSGKDVIWIPTRDALVRRMLELARTGKADVVVDLGSGDGRIPIVAAREYGATARGIEYDGRLVKLARCVARSEGVEDRVTFVEGDIFASDFRDATVITMYLLPELNLKLRPTLLGLSPGTRVVSHAFDMGDWQADGETSLPGGTAYLWIVPARVEGRWRVATPQGTPAFDLVLEQRYQRVSGTARAADGSWQGAVDGTLDGARLQLRVEGARDRVPGALTATVRGNRLAAEGTSRGQTMRYDGVRAAR
jgi:SAM-dependent methyltransferase